MKNETVVTYITNSVTDENCARLAKQLMEELPIKFNRITAQDPIYRPPAAGDQYLGAHSMVIMGYSNISNLWLVKNSFGSEWGENGYCYISPVALLNGYIFEMWTLEI